MKYLASQIVKRAFNLADLSNTDFVSHEEAVQYLNDSFTEIFNNIVNHGEKVFVKEVKLSGTGGPMQEFDLPWDLYRICVIRDPFSGYNLLRHVDTESDMDASYEIVNDKLRVYGATSNLIMTYYVKPLWLTYPDKTIDITDIIKDKKIISTAGNNILLSDGSIYNVISKDKVGQIGDIEEGSRVILGNGHLFAEVQVNDDYLSSFINYSGDAITEAVQTELPKHIIYDQNYNLFEPENDKQVLRLVDEDDNHIDLFREENDKLRIDYLGQSYNIPFDENPDTYFPLEIRDERPSFAVGTNIYQIDLHDGYPVLLLYSQPKKDIIIGKNTRYGSIQSNGTAVFVYSNAEETELNLPNNIYFSLIAANLAIRFASKQNADISQLQLLYDNMTKTYLASLSQNADMPRIRNVY